MKREMMILDKLSSLICSEMKNKRNLSFEDRIKIVHDFLRKFKTVKHYCFEQDVPCGSHIGTRTHLKDSVRVQMKTGHGKYNYSDCVRIYFKEV